MKVLIIVAGGMGDTLMTTPMFRALKRARPDASITVFLVQSINAQLLVNNPYVDEVVDWNQLSKSNLKLIWFLRKERFTHAFHNHSCSRWLLFLIPFVVGIPKRFGFDRSSIRKNAKSTALKLLLTDFVPYTAKSGLRTLMNLNVLRLIDVENTNIKYDLHLERDAIVEIDRVGIHPGCEGKSAIKRWPAENFMDFARKLVSEKGKQVVFYIGPAEKELKDVIRTENGIEVIESSTIAELVKNMSKCSSFVSNDSGVSHIAAALEIPTIVLFGPTQPDEYLLPTKNINICVTGHDCTQCFNQKECLNCKPTCLTTISVDQVMSGYMDLIEKI